MSTWTHVAAVFRIDAVRGDYTGPTINGRAMPDWDKAIGRTICDAPVFDEDDYLTQMEEMDWAAYNKHPNRFVPTGSEGSLQRAVWVNPKGSHAARYTVTVFGDLRDYSDHKAVKEWFYSVVDKCHIRQAVCHCVVDGYGEWVWQSSWGSHGDDAE